MRSGERQIRKVPAQGGDAVQVTEPGGFDSYESTDGECLYDTRPRETAGVWRLPLRGGEESQVAGLDGVKHGRAWALIDQGNYFAVATPASAQLTFYSLATGRVSDITSLPKKPTCAPPLLAASRDGRSVLYAQRDSANSDIMVVENVR